MSNRVIKKQAVVISILVVCVAVIVFVILQNWAKPKFEYINCMPPVLDGKQAELCRQAEEANYPYIAY